MASLNEASYEYAAQCSCMSFMFVLLAKCYSYTMTSASTPVRLNCPANARVPVP